MPVRFQKYVQCQVDADEIAEVTKIADSLLDYLNQPNVQQAIAIANKPGQNSSCVQAVFTEFTMALGFQREAKGLFANSSTTAAIPNSKFDGSETLTATGVYDS